MPDRLSRAQALKTYFLFLELRHKAEIHQMTGRVAECPIDEVNRPRGRQQARLRIPPNADQVGRLFAGWRGELATCRKFAPAARNYAACRLMAEVGLRVNEACQLDLADIKWDLGRWRLGDMSRERAESYLRQLAEAELRRARTLPAAGIPGRHNTARLALAAQALVAVGAVDIGTAEQIRADLELAVAVRQPGQENQASPGQRGLPPDARKRLARLMHSPAGRAGTVAPLLSGLSTGQTRTAAHRASWRVVPVGQVIAIPDDDVRRELLLVAYLQSADGARFTMAGGLFGPLRAVDDHGARYLIECRGGLPAGLFVLRPDPPRHIRWLDLTTAPGEPATRIDLDPQIPAPEVTVTRNAHSPAELLLDFIAARILCSGAAVPQYDLEHPPAGAADLRAFIADGPGGVVAALHAAGALPPASPVPGQLAGLCIRVGVPGHGITAPPATDLPEPWHSMLTRPRRLAQAAPAPGIAAATIAELPELDGTHITILGLHHATIVGLHNSATQTIVHMLVSGVTPEDDWTYGRVIRPLPALWVRDSSGRWHATRTKGTGLTGTSGEVILWLEIVPQLDRGTPWIDVVATGRSAEARVRLPICWKLNPQQRSLGSRS